MVWPAAAVVLGAAVVAAVAILGPLAASLAPMGLVVTGAKAL